MTHYIYASDLYSLMKTIIHVVHTHTHTHTHTHIHTHTLLLFRTEEHGDHPKPWDLRQVMEDVHTYLVHPCSVKIRHRCHHKRQ